MAKYANLQVYPIILPSPAGGSVYFRPSEYRTGSWWSRFVGHGQLSEVDDAYSPSRDFRRGTPTVPPKPVVSPRRIPEAPGVACNANCEAECQANCEASCQVACETDEQVIKIHDHYEQIGKSFNCRYCEWNTKDEAKIDVHMQAYHAAQVQVAEKAKEESPDSPSTDQQAEDPGRDADQPTVPDQGSLPPGPAVPEHEVVEVNDYWRVVDGMCICKKCLDEDIKWQTLSKGAMARHAKRYHDYVKPE